MPDAPGKTSAPASDKNPVNPDMVGEELADNANIWHVYDRVAKEDDERRTKSWDYGLNNLALFAALFSAVTTAFIIEARKDLEPDYAQLTFLVLNATAFGEKPVHQPFAIPSSARTVNCLWVASLILSLSAALIAIMGKDWIGMYTSRPVCNLRQWAEMRTYRLLCVERWYMSGVIAAAPVLLHVSLISFGAGLVLFISSDPLTHRLTLGLSLAAGALYLITTLSAIVFPASPFKSPATQMLRAAFSASLSYLHDATIRPKRNLVGTLLQEVNVIVVGRADESAFVRASVAEAHPQPALTGHAALLSRLHHYIYPPERNAVLSLLRDVNTLVVGRGDGFGLLPRSSPIRQRHNLHSIATIANAAGKTLATSLQSLPSSLRAAYQSLQWSRAQSWLRSTASLACRLSLDWFLSSTWTDLPADRRPELLAEALSWLSSASQAPDVFRAIVFALGDLDVGPQVGKHTPPALRTRLRAEIRRTWQQVDFLTLSRYLLADHNTPGDSVLFWSQFTSRFDLSKDSALRCEDGLAAVIRVDPGFIRPRDLVKYSPDQVAQPRMHEFLLPHVQPQRHLTVVLILLTNRYRKHLWMTNSFNLRNLEAHLYETLDADTRDAYATAVTVKYGGTAGALELLTFLCCCACIDDIIKPAAVELLVHVMESFPTKEHWCLAYLFGSSDLWDAAWKDIKWSWYPLWKLYQCLDISRRYPFEPSSARTPSDDRQFDLALARTFVMLLSPGHETFIMGAESRAILFLFGYICQPSSRRLPDSDDKLNIVRLIPTSGAILRIVGMPEYFAYDEHTVNCGTAILAEIISELGRHIRCATVREGERLFQALVFTEVNGENNSLTWDLGYWLRAQAPEILRECQSSASAMQSLHDALVGIYPLCEENHRLRAHWDRIGYPGRPGDIFSSPFMDAGAFFDNAEAPRARPGDISSLTLSLMCCEVANPPEFDDPWLDLTEFFDGAEEGNYSWP